MAQRRLQRAQAALEEGRRLVDAGELRPAAERLERARADFAAELSLDGVRTVRAEAERAYQQAEEADEPFYEQLLYASAQNVRFLSRRDATRRGVEWVDPHPELDQPGRPEIRVERGVGRKAKWWLVGVAVAVLAAAGGFAAWAALSYETAYLVNDRGQTIQYVRCGDSARSSHDLAPGEEVKLRGFGICVDVLGGTGAVRCLHLNDGETGRVSEAKPCA